MTSTDLVVVLPGIMGSTLHRDGVAVWRPSAGGLLNTIKAFGRSSNALRLPEGIGDAHPGDGVEPGMLISDLHALPGIWTPVKGYDRLLARLRALGYNEVDRAVHGPAGNLLPVAYDWRLSNRYNGERLGAIVGPALERWRANGGDYADARLVFVCHSMGGLVARWYIERCGGAEITRKLITFGTPYRGTAKALEQLVNGITPSIGPLSIDLTEFARSLPSLHQLMPEYACIQTPHGLAKTTEVAIPWLRTVDVEDAMHFHGQLREAESARAASATSTHAIVGTKQPTMTTLRIANGSAEADPTYQGDELFGDSTVALVGASRADVPLDSNTLRRIPDKHGNLQRNRAALDELEGVLTATRVRIRAATTEVSVTAPELVLAGEPLPVSITVTSTARLALRVAVVDELGTVVVAQIATVRSGAATTTFPALAPGAYSVDVTALDAAVQLTPVVSTVLVWG